jgi:hypothetical protein
MQKEKIALIALVIVIIAALSVFWIAVSTDYLDNLFKEEKIIAYSDYADANYIGHYASNGTIFAASYENPANKSNPTPLNIFVTLNASATPGGNFNAYSNLISDEYVKGFIENLVGMKQGETKTTAIIPARDAYGVTPTVGDVLNLSVLANRDYRIKIIDIEKNVSMPALYKPYFGNGTTDLYTFREEFHYISEVIDTYYDPNLTPQWVNATVVTKTNETLLWTYTTPNPDKLTNLTWVDSSSDSNPDTAYTTIYPANASSIDPSSINNSTFVVTHTPKINDTIQFYNYTYQSGAQFIVRNITKDNITGYFNSSTSENQTTQIVRVFPGKTVIMRNQTQNITPSYPKEWVVYVLSMLRTSDHRAIYSLSALADKDVYFEITVVKIYKAS